MPIREHLFAAAQKNPLVETKIEGLELPIYLRKMNMGESQVWEKRLNEVKDSGFHELVLDGVIMAIHDKEGTQVLKPEDKAALKAQPTEILNQIFDKWSTINQPVTKAHVEVEAGNSPNGPSDSP